MWAVLCTIILLAVSTHCRVLASNGAGGRDLPNVFQESLIPSGMLVIKSHDERAFDGYLVFCPEYEYGDEEIVHGPRIYNPSGTVFWAGEQWTERCMNAQIQTFNNQPVLTFWYNNGATGHFDLPEFLAELIEGVDSDIDEDEPQLPEIQSGSPYGVVLDTEYRELARVHPVGGPNTDLHEFYIPPHGSPVLGTTGNSTAIMILMQTLWADLTSVGGSRFGWIYSPFIQELDIMSGALLWEWDASQYLDLTGSYAAYTGGTFEYAHCNAVVRDAEGDYLMSFRFYDLVVKVSGATKEILWRLGGKDSDFTFGNGSTFIGQHDPQWVPGTDYTELTLFDNDNNNCGVEPSWGTARGVWLRLDYSSMHVELVREFLPPWWEVRPGRLEDRQTIALDEEYPTRTRAPVEIEGGLQLLPNGNVLVVFGSAGSVIEYAPPVQTAKDVSAKEGPWDIVFEGNAHQVYRAYKYDRSRWPGTGHSDG